MILYTYISYVQIVWTRCASGFISSIGKYLCNIMIGLASANMIADTIGCNLQKHFCHLAHWQCLRAAIASACAFHSAA